MKQLDGYYNVERARQAGAMCDILRKAGLGINEMCLLKILARKMGRETNAEGQIKDGCRASLETLERESLLERRAIGKALGRLVDAGIITKTLDRHRRVAGEPTKEGQRRKDMGLPLDASHVRQPLGRPRKDGSSAAQWQHCIYRANLTVWDEIKWDKSASETGPKVDAPMEVSAAEQAAADTLDIHADQKAVEDESTVEVSKENINEVFKITSSSFLVEHDTYQVADNPRGAMNKACKELAQLCLEYSGSLSSAGDFLRWVPMAHPEEVNRLLGANKKGNPSVRLLGSPAGLLHTIDCLWKQFVEIDSRRFDGQVDSGYDRQDDEDEYEPVGVGNDEVDDLE
jgi:hypothetical protein